MRNDDQDPWLLLAGLARGCCAPELSGPPPGFATRVVAAWRAERASENTIEALWLRLALRFAVPSMALALAALALVQPTDLPLEDPAFAAVESFNPLDLEL